MTVKDAEDEGGLPQNIRPPQEATPPETLVFQRLQHLLIVEGTARGPTTWLPCGLLYLLITSEMQRGLCVAAERGIIYSLLSWCWSHVTLSCGECAWCTVRPTGAFWPTSIPSCRKKLCVSQSKNTITTTNSGKEFSSPLMAAGFLRKKEL